MRSIVRDIARADPMFELGGAVGDPCARPKARMGPWYGDSAEQHGQSVDAGEQLPALGGGCRVK